MQEEPQTKTDMELAYEWIEEQKMLAELEEIFGTSTEPDDDEDYVLDEYELYRQEQGYESRFAQVTA